MVGLNTEGDVPYPVAVGALGSVSSSPRLRARNAETFARFMQRSEQYRLVLLVLVSMNTPWQPAAWQTPNLPMPRSVSRTARPIAAPAAYLSATDPLSV